MNKSPGESWGFFFDHGKGDSDTDSPYFLIYSRKHRVCVLKMFCTNTWLSGA